MSFIRMFLNAIHDFICVHPFSSLVSMPVTFTNTSSNEGLTIFASYTLKLLFLKTSIIGIRSMLGRVDPRLAGR